MEDLPFVAEYAKSSRSSCRICKEPIQKDSLRMGIMVQSPKFDGKVPLWHHSHCFFQKKQVKTTADIANFSNLRWDDQKSIKDKIEKGSTSSSKSSSASSENNDFAIEYAKSSRSTCKVCSEKIVKGEIRVSKLDTESSEARRFGPIPQWRHLDCFVKVRQELGFVESGDRLPGFKNLSDEDKEDVKEKITGTSLKRSSDGGQPPPKKKKTDITKEELEFRVQNQLLYDMRDKLKANLKKKHMLELLEFNKQHISTGESNLLDNLADCMVFGALKNCPECQDGTPRFKNDAYRCSGNLTEWTKCQYVSKYPERKLFKVPEEMKEEFEFLKKYKCVIKERMFPEVVEVNNKKGLPLENFKVAVFGKFKGVPKSIIIKKVEELGATIQSKVTATVNVCISTEDEVNKNGSHVTKAAINKIHIVSPNFIEDIKKGATPAIAIKENLLCTWGDDPVLKFGIKQENVRKKEALNDSAFAKSAAKSTMKITMKGGNAAVDPDSGMEDSCHVYEKKDEVFNVVLGKVDIARGTNTYYKLQILQSNKGSSYWLFRSWGRVGTTIGDKKLEKLKLEDAIAEFKRLYQEKTGNEWSNRKNFKKQPGLLYPLEIDYGQDCEKFKELKPGDNSKLPKPVQELICLIFDIEAMKKAMVEFEIDLKKMPLGKLSKRQIETAYSVLNEAQQVLLTGCNAAKILDASNRFYTLIPHDFGLRKPPLLDNEELIKSKIQMLDSLLEIEFAYNLIKDDGGISTKDPIDEHYEKLATDIEVLPKDTDEYSYIKDYLKKTHAQTHDQYTLKLNEVFKINRHGEKGRYKKKSEKLHNKKLLWHGSRLTNYVGILSQGLRIAPPEAPVTGYMFGKGIYFADMVSKSANYCFANKQNSTGLMLLCEVALGNMYEKPYAEYITQLPPDKHSTKGLGHTVPDPTDKVFLGDVEIPYGKPSPSNVGQSQLLYNEYIVYDVNQVNIKYLLKVNFKFKY
ncbi:poly [ADP-ribose] polymerase 1-like [Uloborus diversus]|uniref:poly [ADP-ribose] polymerase 1-like n=1 Tax=Uloborus diversus TaxID=327109 RepID=UPI002409F47E|nr:poly [ADP-ribose] polymerase 1-like [Uloborus diversus]